MALPGAEGGLSTNRMDFTMESTKYVDDCINDSQHVHRLVDMNEIMNARNDRYWETKQLVNAIKPRAWPVWGIPAELLLIALLPKYRCTARRGVGFTNSLVAPVFNKRFDDMLSCIRRTEATPVVWHRSRVFFATKPGAVEPNLKAVQMPHGFDATGMAWYGGRQAEALANNGVKLPPWVHGSVPGRGREGAPSCIDSSSWRLQTIGASYALSNYDATNAFACTDQDSSNQFSASRVLEKDFVLFRAHHINKSFSVILYDQIIEFTTSVDGLMGHTIAPPDFVGDFATRLGEWSMEICTRDATYRYMWAVEKIPHGEKA